MAEHVTVWGKNGLELEIEEEWVNPLLTTGAISLENLNPPLSVEDPELVDDSEDEVETGERVKKGSGKRGK